jgi:serine/threonine-protein kinase HipA
MSECRLYELDGVKHFMTRRFDRTGDARHLVQTYCALRHLPPGRTPVSLCTYEGLFDTIVALEMGYDSIDQMFRRMVFNVLAGECDDHAKNFSFMMTQGGRWKLAPAYDLTGRQGKAGSDAFDGWINRHALSVNGRFSNIRDDDLVLIGERYGLGNARSIVEEIKSVLLD